MSFQQALSGLNASSKSLDVIGNNIANSSTVGFKASQAQFADVFAASLSGGGGGQIGIGTRLATVAQQFTQGNITTTNNPLDVAINGRGFFRLSDSGTISYSRNGQFQMDKEGYIISNTGSRLTGYMADPATGVITGALGDLQLSQADKDPSATSALTMAANLDANAIAPATTAFPWVAPASATDVPDPRTYNSATSFTVYDSLGNSHIVNTYFVKSTVAPTAPATSVWNAYMSIDGRWDMGSTGVPAAPNAIFEFDTAGQVVPTSTTINNITFTTSLLPVGSPAGAANITIPATSFDYSGMTQFGSPFSVSTLYQNGYTSGRLAGFSIGQDGVILARYSNGQSQNLGQVALANFINPQGLSAKGDNKWVETPDSGQPLVGGPGTGVLGLLQSASVEEANVDLTQELVAMIVQQRAYQANAQTIKTQDQVMQTLVNLR